MQKYSFCVDLGNRTVQGCLGNSQEVEAISSLLFRSGRMLPHKPVPQTHFVDYLDGVHGTQYAGETVVVGNGSSRLGSAKPIYRAESTPGTGKLQYAHFFVLGMLPTRNTSEAEIDTLFMCHPEPTQDVITSLESKLIGKHVYRKDGQLQTRTIKSLQVLPEGEPAYNWLIATGQVNQRDTNVVIDIGGLTTIVTAFDELGSMQRYVLRRGGTLDLANRISASIQPDMPGEVPDLTLIMDGMLNGSFMYGTRFSFREAFLFQSHAWTQDLLGEFGAKFDNLLDRIAKVAFVGGGSRYLHPKVILPLKEVGWFVPPNPENANIVGLATLAKSTGQFAKAS